MNEAATTPPPAPPAPPAPKRARRKKKVQKDGVNQDEELLVSHQLSPLERHSHAILDDIAAGLTLQDVMNISVASKVRDQLRTRSIDIHVLSSHIHFPSSSSSSNSADDAFGSQLQGILVAVRANVVAISVGRRHLECHPQSHARYWSITCWVEGSYEQPRQREVHQLRQRSHLLFCTPRIPLLSGLLEIYRHGREGGHGDQQGRTVHGETYICCFFGDFAIH